MNIRFNKYENKAKFPEMVIDEKKALFQIVQNGTFTF